jgi:glutathione S-transferase
VFGNRVVRPLLGMEADLAAADAALAEEMPKIYAYLENVIDGDTLVGDALTLADISVASVLVNMDLCDGRPETSAYPNLCAWSAAMHARPSFVHWRAVCDKILGK